MKNPQYIEGPEALKNFEQFAQAVLQAPKPEAKLGKKNHKRTTARKSKRPDKD